MPSQVLPSLEFETQPSPDASVIWMHGLGADGHDFAPIVPELALPRNSAIRFVFPHAPMRPVTLNGGMTMRAWYDIVGADLSNRADEGGIRGSQASVEALIAREKLRGVSASRIVLAGFSQGGVIALQAGLRFGERLAGIMALSTYLALPQALSKEASEANREIPIFMAHGTYDPVVRIQWAEASRAALLACGYSVDWRTYSMPHSVCPEEIQAIGLWLRKVLQLDAQSA